MAAAVIIVFLFLWHLREDAEYCQHLCPLLVLFRCLPVGRSGLDGLEALGNEEPYLPLKSWVPCLAQESLFLIMHLEIPGGGVVVTLLGTPALFGIDWLWVGCGSEREKGNQMLPWRPASLRRPGPASGNRN